MTRIDRPKRPEAAALQVSLITPRVRSFSATADRPRQMPTRAYLVRRRVMMQITKWLLPAAALGLLAIIAAWPEITRLRDAERHALSQFNLRIDGAQLTDAKFRGVDQRGRPYTLTAHTARQTTPERVDLTDPQGDIMLESGAWLNVRAEYGAVVQKTGQLDLWTAVVLYRDDGTTLRTNSATVNFNNGAAAGSEPVLVEGPFGQLRAQSFTLTDHGGAIQFGGPIHLVLVGTP